MRAAMRVTARLLAGLIPTETIPSEPFERSIESHVEAPVAGTLKCGARLASFCSTCHGREL